jgi:alkylhydroperoxidase family enzyme
VLQFAAEMTATPAEVSVATFAALQAHLSEAQVIDLAARVGWENFRARFNRALGVEAGDFSHGQFCALPERPSPPQVTA